MGFGWPLLSLARPTLGLRPRLRVTSARKNTDQICRQKFSSPDDFGHYVLPLDEEMTIEKLPFQGCLFTILFPHEEKFRLFYDHTAAPNFSTGVLPSNLILADQWLDILSSEILYFLEISWKSILPSLSRKEIGTPANVSSPDLRES